MKKFILCMFVALASLCTAQAQSTPHAIGLHIGGSTIDLEYQYHFSKKNFLDVTAGVFNLNDGFAAQAVYNWNIKQWDNWTPKFATWKIWGGVGAGFGAYDFGDSCDGLFLGPVGTFGFGFTLRSCPLSVGLDYRPMVAFNLGDGDTIIKEGFRNVGLTLTYRF